MFNFVIDGSSHLFNGGDYIRIAAISRSVPFFYVESVGLFFYMSNIFTSFTYVFKNP